MTGQRKIATFTTSMGVFKVRSCLSLVFSSLVDFAPLYMISSSVSSLLLVWFRQAELFNDRMPVRKKSGLRSNAPFLVLNFSVLASFLCDIDRLLVAILLI